MRRSGHPAAAGAAREDCAILSRVFKYEFIYDPDQSFDGAFASTWAEFERRGWVCAFGEGVEVPEARRPLLSFLQRGVGNFVEAYHLVCRQACRLEEARSERDFILAAVREGEKLHAAGELYAREACSTAVMGNAVRLLVGVPHRRLVPLSFVGGAIFLCWADLAARTILPGQELPVGILRRHGEGRRAAVEPPAAEARAKLEGLAGHLVAWARLG